VREVVIPVNVNSITGTIIGELAAEACFRELGVRGLKRHHALADALALRAAYVSVKAEALSRSSGVAASVEPASPPPNSQVRAEKEG
jgi:hypothetical protein